MIYHETKHGVLYCGDCLDILPTLGVKADLVLTDPPYGLNKKLSGGSWNKNETWDYVITNEQIRFLISFGKNAIIWGGNYYELPASRCWLVWDKPYFPSMADCELAWTSFDRNVKKYSHNRGESTPNLHPTQKPVALLGWCLKNYSKEQDLIIDPFAGSGTTAIACIRYNRRYILIEKEEKYCEIAAKRIDAELEQADIFRSEQ